MSLALISLLWYCLISSSCLILSNPMDCSPTRLHSPWDSPGKNAEVGCYFLLQGFFPTQRSNSSLLHCRKILYDWAIWEALLSTLCSLSPPGFMVISNSSYPTMNPFIFPENLFFICFLIQGMPCHQIPNYTSFVHAIPIDSSLSPYRESSHNSTDYTSEVCQE